LFFLLCDSRICDKNVFRVQYEMLERVGYDFAHTYSGMVAVTLQAGVSSCVASENKKFD